MASEAVSVAGCWQHRKLTDDLLDISESDGYRDSALVASAILANNSVELVSPWQATATLSVRVRTKKRKSHGKSHQPDDGGEYGTSAKWDPSSSYPAWRIGVDPLTYHYVVDNGRYRAVKLARKLEIQTGVRRNTEKLSPEQKPTPWRHRDSGRKSEDANAAGKKSASNSPPSDTDRIYGVGLPAIRRYPTDMPDITVIASGDFNRTENNRQTTIKSESNSARRASPKTRPDSASLFDLPAIDVPLTSSFGCRGTNLLNSRPFDDTIIAHVQRLEVKSSKLFQNGEQRSRSEPVPVLTRCDALSTNALSTSYQSKHAVPLSLHPLDVVQRRPTPEPLPLFPVRVSEAMKEAHIDIQKLLPKPTTKTAVNNGRVCDDLRDLATDSPQREFGLMGWTKSKKSPRKTVFPGHHLRNDAQPGILNGALIYRSDTVGEDMFSVKRIDTTLEQRNASHSFNDVLAPREHSPPTARSNGESVKTFATLGGEVRESIWTSASANAPRYVYKQNALSTELQHQFITSTKFGGSTPEQNLPTPKAKTGRTGHRRRTKGKGGSSNVDVVSGGFMGVLIGQTRQRTRKSCSDRDILPEISGQRIKSKLTTDVNP